MTDVFEMVDELLTPSPIAQEANMGTREDREEDYRRERIDARRGTRGCECGDDLPGDCPGRQFCPYSSWHEEHEEDDDEELDDPRDRALDEHGYSY